MAALVQRVALTLMAEAHQFYLEDSGAEGDAAEVWNGTTAENWFGAVPGLVVVGTGTQGVVAVQVELWDGEPELDNDQHDHLGETSLQIRSGTLLVTECQGDPRLVEINVDPRWYRIRIACDGLDTSDTEDNNDSYRCQVWPAPSAPDRVITWYEPWSPGPAPENPFGLRVMTGARAIDEHLKMRPIGRRSLSAHLNAFLSQDGEGAYWEYAAHGKHGTDLIEVPATEAPKYELYKLR
jgi:hypothetical protein